MADGKDLTKFNQEAFLNDFKEQLRARIRVGIAESLPQETLDAMIAAEAQSFLNDKIDKDYYGNKIQISGLKELVRQLLAEDIKKRVSVYLHSPAWEKQFDGQNTEVVGEKLKELITQTAPLLLQSMMTSAVTQAVDRLRNEVHNGVR